MKALDFNAFAVPRSVDVSQLPFSAYEDRGVRVRHVDASAAWIGTLTEALSSARLPLGKRPAADIAGVLGRVGSRFLNSADPLRSEALTLVPPTAGVSPEMAATVLDGMAADWTEDHLVALLEAELGSAEVLDRFGNEGATRRTFAVGPALCVQVLAGSVPGVGVTALIRSLLVKAPTLIKPGKGDAVLPVLFARALREADEELADALAVVYWPGGRADVDLAAMTRADVVAAYGSDASVGALRSRCPVTTRFVAYHHRTSVGIVGREALTEDVLQATAEQVAESVALFDQRGCVSPRMIFLEEGAGATEPFARELAEQLSRLEERLPSGPLSPSEASRLHQVRGSLELLAAGGEALVIHGGVTPWTVVMGAAPVSLGDCPGRAVLLRTVREAEQALEQLAPVTPYLQTVGVAGLGDRLERIAQSLGSLGASRVVPFSTVPFPPPWWHHDGRGPLRDLVRWVDLEESAPYSSS